MKKILKNRKIIYILILIVTIIGIILLNNKLKILEKITNGRLQNADEEKEELPLISYQVYDNSDESKIKTLITVNDSNGIEYVEYPDGTKLDTNNKTQISIDYNMTKDENYTFKIKTKSNEEIQESTVCANDDFVNDKGVSISKINNGNGYKVIDIENEINIEGYKTYYQIGKTGNWIEGTGKIGLADYDLTTNNLLNEDNTITINAKIENQTTKNVVNITKKYEVETSEQNDSYNSESLLKALENGEIGTGVHQVTVEDETYNLKVYCFNENLNIKADTALGTEEDVATASEYAKNMIVLKVNGDLTIDEGVTLTAYASKNGYGGPKGMTIYCTGTLTNNGTISMTARGAKAEGQDVYLWKNTDNTYEFVPATGGNGSTGQSGNAEAGTSGVNRQTGGGGAGGSGGSGTAGTSYSGGTGGGGCYEYSGDTRLDGKENGGAGGKAGSSRHAGCSTGGGAGNPGGKGLNWIGGDATNGTGGLLILVADNIENNNVIESKGSNGGRSNNNRNFEAGGGSSGGGSINIFGKNNIKKGTITTNGGIATYGYDYGNHYGGAGGTGSISIGQLADGTYTSIYTNYTIQTPVNTTGEFNYTGSYSKYEVKETGYYKIECFGANGGYALDDGNVAGKGGKGGYTSGIIQLNQGEVLYVYVGGQGNNAVIGKDSQGGYNGGGLGTWDNSDDETAGARRWSNRH